MKRIIFLILLVVVYGATLVWKDKLNIKEKMKDVPTLYSFWEKNGTPVKIDKIIKGDLVDSVIVTGNYNKGVITCFVSRDIAAQLKTNSHATVARDGLIHEGYVESVSNNQILLTGLHEVRIKFQNFAPGVKTVLVDVEVGSLKNVNLVSREAISIRGGTPHLFLIENDVAVKKEVKIIGRNKNFYAVNNTVEEGSSVVISDQRYLVDGTKVLLVK